MKRTLASVVLALALTAASAPPASATVFEDVAADQYYSAAVAWAVEQGITAGTSKTTFSPDAPCTRGQILTFLWRSAGSPEPRADTANPYSDVKETTHYYVPVLWALEEHILTAEETLDPDTPCSRAEVMSYFWRYAGSPAPDAPAVFDDMDPAADYALAVSWAVETGVTAGASETAFSPDAPCTRGQIVTFLRRSLEKEPASEAPAEPPARPLRTLTGSGPASSLGLDGSAFTSHSLYESRVQVDIYSPTEAAFSITVPFPLFQAWNYSVRWDEEDSGVSYVFSYYRWDEAFADLVDWPEDHNYYHLSEMTGQPQSIVLEALDAEADRMGGTVSWRVVLPEESTFRFDSLSAYQMSCEVNSAPLPWAQPDLTGEPPPQSGAAPETGQAPDQDPENTEPAVEKPEGKKPAAPSEPAAGTAG